MIETRYKVVNKWLREIRDIDVQESSVKGSSGSFGVTTPLHCKVGEYLDTNLKFHDNTFQKSLNSGLLRTYLQRGDIIQVYYDTVAQKEVDTPYGNVQPQEQQVNSEVIAMAKVFQEAGVTANDLKNLVGLLKQQQANVNNTKTETEQTNVVNAVNETQPSNTKAVNHIKPTSKAKTVTNIKKTKSTKKKAIPSVKTKDNGTETQNNNLDKSDEISYKKATEDSKTKALQVMFNNFNYQQRLNYIKTQCESIEMLKWIQSNFHQTAIFNAATNKIQALEKAEIESI